jgi:ADP-heptose:LPS heptosyltransferase
LDLVISVDTAVAHLASALGIQTLILLPFISDWRWGVDGESTAWYPNARLIRQVQHNDWHTVLDEVKGIIYGQFASAHRP